MNQREVPWFNSFDFSLSSTDITRNKRKKKSESEREKKGEERGKDISVFQ